MNIYQYLTLILDEEPIKRNLSIKNKLNLFLKTGLFLIDSSLALYSSSLLLNYYTKDYFISIHLLYFIFFLVFSYSLIDNLTTTVLSIVNILRYFMNNMFYLNVYFFSIISLQNLLFLLAGKSFSCQVSFFSFVVPYGILILLCFFICAIITKLKYDHIGLFVLSRAELKHFYKYFLLLSCAFVVSWSFYFNLFYSVNFIRYTILLSINLTIFTGILTGLVFYLENFKGLLDINKVLLILTRMINLFIIFNVNMYSYLDMTKIQYDLLKIN